jgi:hypothetical protein
MRAERPGSYDRERATLGSGASLQHSGIVCHAVWLPFTSFFKQAHVNEGYFASGDAARPMPRAQIEGGRRTSITLCLAISQRFPEFLGTPCAGLNAAGGTDDGQSFAGLLLNCRKFSHKGCKTRACEAEDLQAESMELPDHERR